MEGEGVVFCDELGGRGERKVLLAIDHDVFVEWLRRSVQERDHKVE